MLCFGTACVRAYLWKIAEFTFPFYSRTAYNGAVCQWYLVLLFSTSQWFGTIEQFCAINVCFLMIKTKTSKTASNCWRFETVLVFIFGLESFVVVYKIKLWFNFVDYDKLFFWNYYLRSIFIRDRSFITSQWGGGGGGGGGRFREVRCIKTLPPPNN